MIARDGRGMMEEMGEGGQNAQISSCMINKLWRCNIQHYDIN